MSESTLPTTAWAVLGLLSFDDELTAYELKHRADRSLGFFYWSPAMSAVYTELGRLGDAGLVLSREAGGGPDKRPRRLYRISARGRRALADWVRDSGFEPNQLKNFLCLRLFYAHLVEPDDLREGARAHVEWATRMRDTLADVSRGVDARKAQDPRFRYAAIVIEWGLELYDLERKAARRVLRRLDELEKEG